MMVLHAAAATETAVLAALVHEMLIDVDAGWNIGTFGALAEFHHVAGDPPPQVMLLPEGGEVVTTRGAMRVDLPVGVLAIAYEGLAKDPRSWNHGLSFCLREGFSGMGRRVVLTELGPDRDALRAADRRATLFDVGVGAPHVDYCVRTDDAKLTVQLREAAGQSIVGPGHPAMATIIAQSPHRVAISRLGRVEVYQPIPSGPGARAPVGPHTHLLPQLLRAGRSHSANTPIPEGWVPCLNLHPASPVTDTLGHPRAFDADAHAAFQALLRRYAPAAVTAEKDRIVRAVRTGGGPLAYRAAETRAERKAARVALRQMLHTHPQIPLLAEWLALFNRGAERPEGDGDGGH
ncbi:MAG: hypothetical protein U1E43_00890 [Rhodospirillales bacterium]